MPAKFLKAFIFLIFVVLLFQPKSGPAFNNEPKSFQGISFGADLSSIKNMTLIQKKDLFAFYERSNEKLVFAGATIQRITYTFHRNKFAAAMVEFKSSSNFEKIKSTVFQQYGAVNGDNKPVEKYEWTGKTVGVCLEYSHDTGKGVLFYSAYTYGETAKRK